MPPSDNLCKQRFLTSSLANYNYDLSVILKRSKSFLRFELCHCFRHLHSSVGTFSLRNQICPWEKKLDNKEKRGNDFSSKDVITLDVRIYIFTKCLHSSINVSFGGQFESINFFLQEINVYFKLFRVFSLVLF